MDKHAITETIIALETAALDARYGSPDLQSVLIHRRNALERELHRSLQAGRK